MPILTLQPATHHHPLASLDLAIKQLVLLGLTDLDQLLLRIHLERLPFHHPVHQILLEHLFPLLVVAQQLPLRALVLEAQTLVNLDLVILHSEPILHQHHLCPVFQVSRTRLGPVYPIATRLPSVRAHSCLANLLLEI